MKKVCKVLTLACLLAAILCCLAFHASAAEVVASGYCGGEGDGTNLTWELIDDGTLTISGTGAMGNYEYNLVAGGIMAEITTPWRSNRNLVKTVIIGDDVTSIGTNAFRACRNMTNVTIGASVMSIGEMVFRDCEGLAEIDVSEENLYFCDENGILFSKDKTVLICFPSSKSETTYEIPNGVLAVGVQAFYGCNNLEKVKIPASMTTIGAGAFGACSYLDEIDVSRKNACFSVEDGVLFNKEKTTLICYPSMKKSCFYEIPDGVLMIEDLAFFECGFLIRVTIPASVLSVGDEAFSHCYSLKSVEIGAGVTDLGESAFSECYSLSVVRFKGNAPSVRYSFRTDIDSLYYTTGTTGWIDSSVYDAAASTWNGYKLMAWEDLPLTASGYCGGEGDGTNLSWALSKDGVLAISGAGAMADYTEVANAPWSSYNGNIAFVEIGDNVTTIGAYAFYDFRGLFGVSIGDKVSSIGKCAFYDCGALTDVNIGDSVTDIGDESFAYCDLLGLRFPDSLTSIGYRAFYDCYRLNDVYFKGNAPAVESSAFYSGVTLYYIPGMAGWMDSEAYNAETSTWNGYKLRHWSEVFVPGDINADGETNLKDLTRLFQYLADWDVEVNEAVLDVNGDGSVNLKDQTRLFQYLADWDVEIYPAS